VLIGIDGKQLLDVLSRAFDLHMYISGPDLKSVTTYEYKTWLRPLIRLLTG
jgi:hypothetical protein